MLSYTRYLLCLIWENFTGVRDDCALLRLIAVLMLIFGGCSAVFFYYENQQNSPVDFELKNNLNLDRASYKKIIDRAESILNFKYKGLILADEINGALFANSLNSLNNADNAGDTPQAMSIKAKILSGRNSMIILNIAGQTKNLKLKTGDTFSGGRGRVISINKDYAVLNFDGREIKLQ